MWQVIIERIPSGMVLFCAACATFIPWVIYTINRLLHKHGDPPWMK